MIESDTYRSVMRHKMDAVSIVATSWQGERAGLTVTSLCSLSDAPPTILVCINCRSGAHDKIIAAGTFSVNLLAADQRETAQLFAGTSARRGDARFDNDLWRQNASGLPVLSNALAVLECTLSDRHVFSTHSIFLGTVVEAQARQSAEPLIYFRGAFSSLQQS